MLAENNHFTSQSGNLSSGSSKSLLSFAAQAAGTNTWDTSGHSYLVRARTLLHQSVWRVFVPVFPLQMFCAED